MTQIERLRKVSERMNAISDMAFNDIKNIEGILNSLSLGVKALSSHSWDEESNTETISYKMAGYGRVNGKMRFFVLTMMRSRTGDLLSEEKVCWDQATREDKLHLYSQIEPLVNTIIERANEIASKAEESEVIVKRIRKELFGGDPASPAGA